MSLRWFKFSHVCTPRVRRLFDRISRLSVDDLIDSLRTHNTAYARIHSHSHSHKIAHTHTLSFALRAVFQVLWHFNNAFSTHTSLYGLFPCSAHSKFQVGLADATVHQTSRNILAHIWMSPKKLLWSRGCLPFACFLQLERRCMPRRLERILGNTTFYSCVSHSYLLVFVNTTLYSYTCHEWVLVLVSCVLERSLLPTVGFVVVSVV
jgi:hypothetical protein